MSTNVSAARFIGMALRGSYLPYRRTLVARSRVLRRALTPAEKRLWFDFLRHLPPKFTRQKPLGNSMSPTSTARDAALTRMVLNVVRFTNEDVMRRFEGVCLQIAAMLENRKTYPRSPSAHGPLDRGQD